MSAHEVIKKHFKSLGYRQKDIAQDYEYADVFDLKATKRKVDFVAFTDTPFSYRTASIGVVSISGPAEKTLPHFKSLGAPIWLCFAGDKVEVWKVYAKTTPIKLDEAPIGKLKALFQRYRKQWDPQAVHRAKLLAAHDTSYQLDFVDLGLLQAIESEVRTKLDRTIRDVLRELLGQGEPSQEDIRVSYRLCFLMLAAKVLSDRKHPHARDWPSQAIDNVIRAISSYYGLHIDTSQLLASRPRKLLESAWHCLNYGMSYQHVSVDDLAFIYENTLVSPKTRARYGTHSTPRAVAEFLVNRLELHKYDRLEDIAIFEPFCGSAVLTVAAMKTLRSILPRDWSDLKRHNFLVRRVFLSDIDAFACEVAQLSLVLADYPNKNGWQVSETNLFHDNNLENFIAPNSFVLCNPPFQNFDQDERNEFDYISQVSLHKPLATLKTVLNSDPVALGFVMPQAILMDHYYKDIRKLLAAKYEAIDLVALPDRIFVHSSVESALLVARHLKPRHVRGKTRVSCITVSDFQRKEFLNTGAINNYRSKYLSNQEVKDGNLWLPDLYEIWGYLSESPKLGDHASLHRGIEWIPGHQKSGKSFSSKPKPGFQKGLKNIKVQFQLPTHIYLDCRDKYLKGNPIKLPWEKHKILLNARRLQRGIWKVAAAVDREGLVVSSSVVSCWPNDSCKYNIDALCAVLNSPLIAAHVSARRLRQDINPSGYAEVPLPPADKINHISSLVSEYRRKYDENVPHDELINHWLRTLLDIDMSVLAAYDLPPRLEKMLLDRFYGAKRPVPFDFPDYFPPNIDFNISLREFRSGIADGVQGNWITDVFRPLPENELSVLDFLD